MTATPRPGSVSDAAGFLCLAAHDEDYPLYATCDSCGRVIRCADSTADWIHTTDYRAACHPKDFLAEHVIVIDVPVPKPRD